MRFDPDSENDDREGDEQNDDDDHHHHHDDEWKEWRLDDLDPELDFWM